MAKYRCTGILQEEFGARFHVKRRKGKAGKRGIPVTSQS